jgi:acyl-coenzyme A synthetase/AMP-(fatty) acid ligase
MPESNFYSSKKFGSLSYEQLFDRLSDDSPVTTNYFEQNTLGLLVNFLKAICYNLDFTLIDSDLSEQEFKRLFGGTYVPKIERISSERITGLDELHMQLSKSTSRIILFTSGTTGQPKEVRQSIKSLTREVRIGVSYSGQIWALTYSPTHMAGIQTILQCVMNGNQMIDLYQSAKAEIIEAINICSISHISATPTFYRMLFPIKSPFINVKRISLGGEKSDLQLQERLKEIFPNAKLNNIYASTEAGTLLASKGEGFSIPESRKEVIRIEEGELMVHRSFLGESSELKFEGDWYRTGDMIEWLNEGDGIFNIVGRKNEQINIGGMKVNPNEVEEACMSFGGIRQARVYSRSNSILGNVLFADLVIEEGVILHELELRKYLNNILQIYKVPLRYKVVKELNTSRTGKLKRNN